VLTVLFPLCSCCTRVSSMLAQHEILTRNQVLQLHPPMEQARLKLATELNVWLASVSSYVADLHALTRRSSRQVCELPRLQAYWSMDDSKEEKVHRFLVKFACSLAFDRVLRPPSAKPIARCCTSCPPGTQCCPAVAVAIAFNIVPFRLQSAPALPVQDRGEDCGRQSVREHLARLSGALGHGHRDCCAPAGQRHQAGESSALSLPTLPCAAEDDDP
jgi:hypothetical protein